MRPLLFTGTLVAVVLSGSRADAQSPKVDELIPRATAYAHLFVERFSNVVAEERYEQEVTAPRRKRVLISDFLLVKAPGDDLPILMEDWYPDRQGEFRGKATYGRFRRFEVKTEGTIHP